MRKIFLLVIACCGMHCMQAQVTDFKLEDYKYRTKGYASLVLDGTFTHDLSRFKDKSLPASKLMNTFFFNLTGFIDHSLTVSADMHQQYIGYGGAVYLALNRPDSLTQSHGNFTGYYNRMERFYRKNFFFELGGELGIGAGWKEKTNPNGPNTANADILLGIGTGRLENVNDAQTALLILEALYKKKIIGKVDRETANNFARLVTDLKNRRIFDYRNRTEFELEQIDSFLLKNDIIKKEDIRTFTTINDNLYFSFSNDLTGLPKALHTQTQATESNLEKILDIDGHGDVFEALNYMPYRYILADNLMSTLPITNNSAQSGRFSGQTVYARIYPRAYVLAPYNVTLTDGGVTKTTHFTTTTVVAPTATIGYEKHVPVNMYWQKIYSVNITGFTTIAKGTDPHSAEDKLARYYADLRYGMGYYPNNRTVIEGNFELIGEGSNNAGSQVANKSLMPLLLLNASYFVNKNTAVSANFSSYFIFSKISNAYSQDLSIRLLHYFY